MSISTDDLVRETNRFVGRKKKNRLRRRDTTLPPRNIQKRDQITLKVPKKMCKTPKLGVKKMKFYQKKESKKGKNLVKLVHPNSTTAGIQILANSKMKKRFSKEDNLSKFRIGNYKGRRSNSRVTITKFPKSKNRKKRKTIIIDIEKRESQKNLWVDRIKTIHGIKLRYYKEKMSDFLNRSIYQFYFKRILSIIPPNNEVYPLWVSGIFTHQPLVIIQFDGVLSFEFKNPKAGVDFFLGTGKYENFIQKRIVASGVKPLIRSLAEFFNVVIIVQNKGNEFDNILEEYKRELENEIRGIYYIKINNKKTKTINLNNIFKNFHSNSTQNVIYIAPLCTDPSEIQLRRTGLKNMINGVKMRDCKILSFNDLWASSPYIPMYSSSGKVSKINLCFYPHLMFKNYKKARKLKHNTIAHSYPNLCNTLKSINEGLCDNVTEFLLPESYDTLRSSYEKESLCEHHAILRLMLGQSSKVFYERDLENKNMVFNYKKLKMFEKMRELGVSENSMNTPMLMLKKNNKNLNSVSKMMVKLGDSIDGSKLPIFEELTSFSKILATNNLDLNAIIDISDTLYLVN